VVPPPDANSGDRAVALEIPEEVLGRPRGDPYLRSEGGQFDLGVTVHGEQHAAVVGQEVPTTVI